MDLKSLGNQAKQVLATVAPMLGTAIGGPLGTVAGVAIAKALGTKAGDSAAAETALLNATPDQLLALRKEEDGFKVQMEQLGVTREQLMYADVASARAMQVANKSYTPTILSYAILAASLVGFLGVLFGYVHIPGDAATAAIFGSALTYLTVESKAVLGYWFGSSRGSDAKSDVIADIAKDS